MRRYEHGGDVYSHDHIRLDFSVNLNPLGMPPEVKEAVVSHIDEFETYPDTECRALTRAIAGRDGLEAENILCGNGAADLIYRLCMLRRPGRVLTLAPAFSEYERAARSCGSEIVLHRLLEREGFALTDSVLARITPELDMMFLCNPHNPTGKLADRDLMRQIVRRCAETGVFLIVDECFLPFSAGESLLPFLRENPLLVILRAFTKLYAMAGIRLGYILSGSRAVLEAAGEIAQCWSVSSVAQIAGLAALTSEGWEQRTRELVQEERSFLAGALKGLGLTVYDSDANFLLVKSEFSLYEPLLRRGILIRRCENYEGLDARFFRLGVKLHPQNEALVGAVKELLYG